MGRTSIERFFLPSKPQLTTLMDMTSEIDVDSMTYSEALLLQERLRNRFRGLHGVRGPRVKRDYASWDWGKKNKELAAEHGFTYGYVSVLRRQLGKAPVPGGRHYPACLQWDWSKSDTAISREVGVNVGSVINWRRNLNKPKAPRDYEAHYSGEVPKKPVFDFSAVDWGNLADVEIAKAMGCTREFVRQKRAELKKPKMHMCDLKFNRFVALFKGVAELSHGEAMEKWPGLSNLSFLRWCQRAGIKVRWVDRRRACIHPWDRMNWKLPNKLLGEIWGLPRQRIAVHRCGHQGLDRPAFVCGGSGKVPELFKALVAEEWVKAGAVEPNPPF